jgi:hypothetical protein
MACSRVLHTVVIIIGLDSNLYEMYYVVLRSLLNLRERTDNVIDDDLLQILAIELPKNKSNT